MREVRLWGGGGDCIVGEVRLRGRLCCGGGYVVGEVRLWGRWRKG